MDRRTSRLFFEHEHDAFASMIGSSGKTIQQCAHRLYPDMKPASAYSKLQAQLDPKCDEHLKFSQVLLLMDFCQSYEPLMYMCDETMHARPDRKAPEDEEVKLVAAITSAASVMERAMKQLDYLQNKVKPVAVRAA